MIHTFKTVSARVSGRRAFTLIEILVVVAIIALLVAILLPSLSRARAQARRVACYANLHNIYVGITMYKDANADRIPDWTALGNWFFRRAPGMRDPDDPRSLQETFGLNALLSGVRPAESGTIRDGKRYLSAYSEVWRCPGSVRWMWEKYKNTYAALKLTVEVPGKTGNLPTTIYSKLMMRSKKISMSTGSTNGRESTWSAAKIPVVQDNASYYPGSCGWRGDDSKWSSLYGIPSSIRDTIYPHAYKIKPGGFDDPVNILWLDGNCGRNGGARGL